MKRKMVSQHCAHSSQKNVSGCDPCWAEQAVTGAMTYACPQAHVQKRRRGLRSMDKRHL